MKKQKQKKTIPQADLRELLQKFRLHWLKVLNSHTCREYYWAQRDLTHDALKCKKGEKFLWIGTYWIKRDCDNCWCDCDEKQQHLEISLFFLFLWYILVFKHIGLWAQTCLKWHRRSSRICIIDVLLLLCCINCVREIYTLCSIINNVDLWKIWPKQMWMIMTLCG